MTAGPRSLAVMVIGRVQGVNYRSFTQSEARRLGVSGWVVNRDDGSVEAAFHGPGDLLAELVERCREGPPAANVESLDVRSIDRGFTEEPPPGAYVF
jgi:acylphosphatase